MENTLHLHTVIGLTESFINAAGSENQNLKVPHGSTPELIMISSFFFSQQWKLLMVFENRRCVQSFFPD